MNGKDLKYELDGTLLNYDEYCELMEKLDYPDMEEYGLSGLNPDYHWEAFMVDGYEINIYWK